jgi:hypothetical protein
MNTRLKSLVAFAIAGMLFTTMFYTSIFLYTNNPVITPPVVIDYVDNIEKGDNGDAHAAASKYHTQLPETKEEDDETPIPQTEKVAISHIFSPYKENDEFKIVSSSWRIAAETAKKQGINVELICAVLPEDQGVLQPWARPIILKQKIENYRPKAHPLPTYGEMFTVLRHQGKGEFVMYSNADIATVPDFYVKVWKMMKEDLTTLEYQREILTKTRDKFFGACRRLTMNAAPTSRPFVKAENLCIRDAVVYFENQGGRPPHHLVPLYRFFKNSSVTVDEVFQTAWDPKIPDSRTAGNSMTITRRQFPEADPSQVVKELLVDDGKDMNMDVLNRLYNEEGEYHPGNDMFIMPRKHIPELLMETPFIHLRPSGFLIGQLLKERPNLAWRRVMSSPANMLTFHVGMGTDEWPVRAEVQPRTVLFEVAQYYTRLNKTKESFWPPPWCEDGTNYRDYGTAHFCGKTPGDFCRGSVRLTCTRYWHHGSRDRYALNTMCYRVSRGKTLENPFCQFCNELAGTDVYKCNKRPAKECAEYKC